MHEALLVLLRCPHGQLGLSLFAPLLSRLGSGDSTEDDCNILVSSKEQEKERERKKHTVPMLERASIVAPEIMMMSIVEIGPAPQRHPVPHAPREIVARM